jgi:hypothetical protein
MPVSWSEQRKLNRIDKAVTLSDPRLAAMMVIFTRLAIGEALPARERLPRAAHRGWQVLAAVLLAVIRLAIRPAKAAWNARCRRRLEAAAGQPAQHGQGHSPDRPPGA